MFYYYNFSEIVCNTTLHQFIESYLLTRQKPYITGSPKPLLVLDQKVYIQLINISLIYMI